MQSEMFLVNFLDRSKTDPMFPLFEIVYLIQIIIVLAAIVSGLALIVPACRMRYHLNIRLRVIFSVTHALIYPASRLVMIYHAYHGPIGNDDSIYLPVCTQINEEFLGYYTSLISVLAIDRLIATKYWAWYEIGGCGTLLFFVAQELTLLIVGNLVAALLVFDFIDDNQIVLYFAVVVPIGTATFVLVYRHNRREMEKMKKGAIIHEYSVAKTFQFNENIRLLEIFTKIARPLIFVCIPPFIFYPIYSVVPSGIGYDSLRFFSIAMYELWLSTAALVVFISLPYYEPSLRIPICRFKRSEVGAAIFHTNLELTDSYFLMLNNDLEVNMKN